MAIKDLYYELEDKYYSLIDKTPLTKITDPIDKIIPSFIVFIAVILILIASGIIILIGDNLGEEKDLSFKLIDKDGQALSQAEIIVSFNDKTETITSNAFGKTDKIKVPLNSMVSIEINKTGFKQKTDLFKFTEEGEKIITLETGTSQQGTTKTIKLYDKENRNELITGKTYRVSFSCSNSNATPPATITISNGKGEVIEPADCGILTASVSGNHSESISMELGEESNAVYLDSLLEVNTLTVDVENENGESLDGIKIRIDSLYDNNPNSVFADSSYTFNGQAEFELETGEYKITVFDETGNYYEAKKTIYFNENDLVIFELERAIPEGGYLQIKVTDKDSKIKLSETKVTLYLDDEVFEERTTNSDGITEFYLKDKMVLYDAVINNEQYIVKKISGLSADNTTITVELEKFTGSNAGALKVRAITIEGTKEKPVRNARIALYSVEEDEVILTGLTEKITDTNGTAEFEKIKNGTYKAFAYKGTSSGWSDTVLYDRRNADITELTVNMIIPNGTLKLNIVDEENNPIPFTTVTFFEEGNSKKLKADKTDSNGSILIETKADKQVYFKAEKENFMEYYSKNYPIFDSTAEETIQMIPEKRMDKPEIKITGLFKGKEILDEVSSLEAGDEYNVKMQLIIPNKDYDEAGIHFRVGNDIFLENDFIFIKTVNAPNTITSKYTMFDETNLNDSKKSNTSGDAKWFNSVWLLPEPGVHNVEVLIKVKENARLGQELKLKFRAYADTGSRTERDPTDSSISSRDSLNAAVKEKTFTVGANIFCSSEFCFSATILDLKEDLIKKVSNSYQTKILQKYELQFNIMNNNKTKKHYDAKIQLKNENSMLNFLDYRISNADALTKSGTADKEELPWIELGDFNPNTTITGKTEFITQETKTGAIDIVIVSNQEIVFEKSIQIEVEAPKNFLVEFTPEKIPSTASSLIEFTVYDEETGIEVEDAQIKVIDRFGDLIAGPELTDSQGKAEIIIPGQAPDTKLLFRTEKQEYNISELEVFSDDSIIEITPDKIGIALNTKTQKSDEFSFKIKNLLEFDLELTSLAFTGNFRDLLDEKAMNAWMNTNYGNIIIPSKTTKEIQAKGILSDYALDRKERDIVELDLELELSNGEAFWTKEIPAKISIGIGGEVDDPNCLTIETKEWKTGTEGTKVKIDFSIENACTINGEPVELKDLEAKVNWNSNHVGTYTLTFEGNPVELRSAYYRKLTEEMENRKYTATLAFEPNGGVNGTANAEIILRARNQLDGKDEFIEDKILTEIKIINLEDCIKFSNTELKIKKGEITSFNASTLGCGSSISFTFDSELKLSSNSLTLSSEDSAEIKIDSAGALSGRYLIKAEAKGNSLATKTQIQNIFVTVFEDSCVELSRYEFDIYDSSENEFDGYDTAQLYNYCNEKELLVKVDMQDWSLAMRKSLLPALIAFGVSTATQNKENKENEMPLLVLASTANTVSDNPAPTTAFLSIPFMGEISQLLNAGNLLKSIFGSASPFEMFGMTFVASTLYNYFSADEIEFNAIEDNITIDDIILLEGIKYTTEKIEVLDEEIGLVVDGPFSCFDSVSNSTIDCWDLTFVNQNKLVQKDEFTPIMKILKTKSTEHFWETNYDEDYFNENSNFFSKILSGADLDLEKALKEKTNERNEILQYNKLQFNSFNPEDTTLGKQQAFGSCSIGELTGETGINALPKIKLDWKWNSITENSCDESNENYIYCDATQFSIELLKKIQELTERLEADALTCETNCVYSTIELPALIENTEKTRTVSDKEQLLELVSFNAYLIKDGYSSDFQKDFHEYAVNVDFFNAPTTYYNPTEETGIGVYFKDNSLFEFDYEGSPNAPLSEPGLYKIEINITYNDSSWKLFNGNTPNATIKISMNKLRTAKPNSPLYYLPFDGEIGLTSDNGRIGYGLDYENLIGEPIRINDTTNSIRTVPISVADPVEDLKTVYETDFKKLNMDERAKIMQFERTSTGIKLTYTPSIATPIILETTRTPENPKETVYAFYSITVDGQAQNIGSTGLTNWSGIEANCKDFEDRSSLDYMETPDIHGISQEAANAQITADKTTAYGFIWNNPIRTGKFWLETLIFSPLESKTQMHLISAANDIKISTPTDSTVLTGTSNLPHFIELNGVTSLEITSLQKILDLVETEDVCVGGIGNSSYSYFFWNPEKVDDSINSVKNNLNAEENCILK